jgi:hypothetical protein
VLIPPAPMMVSNWQLLESDLTRALHREGLRITKDEVGDPCVGGVNIAALAQYLSATGVRVKVTPIAKVP